MHDILSIFPQGSLGSSVITTVFVGVLVAVFFNLRLGWILSGLVVPGYLVPLILVQPWSAVVVVAEGIVTYFLILWLFEYLSRVGLWDTVFGRDRFFALLICSVIVRLVFDAWLMPLVGEGVNHYFAIKFDYINELHSFGLIIVALIANQFWKPGFFKGCIPLCVTVAVTYLIVRYGLMEYTNFTMSNLGYLYEDVATSMMASPKAYIILLTTAFIASHMNLHYGWEYSGILIPSLLALMWYQPSKIVTSLVETVFILAMAVLVLRLPIFKKATIEGGRKILLFFTISYLYKFILAYVILWLLPEKKITDYYGFGYLLPTLLAIKMHDKEIVARMIRATLQTSLGAVLIASVAGFALTLVPKIMAVESTDPRVGTGAIVQALNEPLMEVIAREKISLYENRIEGPFTPPGSLEMEAFSEGVGKLLEYGQDRDPRLLFKAQNLLDRTRYRITLVEDRYLVLQESEPRRGWGIYVIDTGTTEVRAKNLSPLLVEVPASLDEWKIMEVGTWLFTTMNARAMAIGEGPKGPAAGLSGDVLSTYGSLFHTFHRACALGDVLQVRAYTPRSARAIAGLRRKETDVDLPEPESTLWVKSRLPEGLHLGMLQDLIGPFQIKWGTPPMANIQREATTRGFAELFLNRAHIRKFFFKPLLMPHAVPLEVREQSIEGYLQGWLLGGKDQLAEKGSEKYRQPKLEELLFFDEEILKPLIAIMNTGYSEGEWSQEGMEELASIAHAAKLMRYRIVRYHHKMSGEDYIILMESGAPLERAYRGTYVFRLGDADDYLIQIPRPLAELRVFEYGIFLFEKLNAGALLISGAHKSANRDGSADIIRIQNKENLFNLVNQALLRESGDRPMLVVQTRAFGFREGAAPPEADILIAFRNAESDVKFLDTLGKGLVQTLKKDGMAVNFVAGSPETSGYEVGGIPQSLYMDQSVNKEFVILWISPETRWNYRQQTENRLQEYQFRALGIPSEEGYLAGSILHDFQTAGSQAAPRELLKAVREYLASSDIVSLESLMEKWHNFRFRRFMDLNTRQAFLVVRSPDAGWVLVANLAPRDIEKVFRITKDGDRDRIIHEYIQSRAAFLEFGPTSPK